MISSILGFISIPLLGWLSDKVGAVCRTLFNISAIILAYPMLSIIVDKSYAPG
jgi:MHS family metabolite:H+ symporter-like MFS transporter